MVAWLARTYAVRGPFLVLCLPSELDFWVAALTEWTDLKVVVYSGTAQSRQLVIEQEFAVADEHGRAQADLVGSEVLLLPYDYLLLGASPFQGVYWRYVVADDGLKLKNLKGRVRMQMAGLS
jgi:SNF2 family DNA or RNA helicase